MMSTLAKLGFSQSYTYFTWRNTKAELVDFMTNLTRSEWPEFYRPNLFANTPDILHAYLQRGGRPAFEARLVLAATLSPSYGIYSGFESCENVPVHDGSEEYLNSEKYEARDRALDGPLLPLVARLNEVRRENPALQRLDNITLRRDRERRRCSPTSSARPRTPSSASSTSTPAQPRGGSRDRSRRARPAADLPRPRPPRRHALHLARGQELRAARARHAPGARPAGGGDVSQVTRIGLERELRARRRARPPEPAPRARRPSGGRRRRRFASTGPTRPRVRVDPGGRRRRSSWTAINPAGVFEGVVRGAALPLRYRLEVALPGRSTFELDDPYRFLPTLGELDLHLAGEGRHEELYAKLGAHLREHGRHRGYRLRRLGAGRALGQRRRRLQRLGRSPAPDALARKRRDLGAVRPRPRARHELQVRGPRAERRPPAQGRPVCVRDRGAPEERLRRLPARARVGRRRLARAAARPPTRGGARCRSTRCTSAPGG